MQLREFLLLLMQRLNTIQSQHRQQQREQSSAAAEGRELDAYISTLRERCAAQGAERVLVLDADAGPRRQQPIAAAAVGTALRMALDIVERIISRPDDAAARRIRVTHPVVLVSGR